MLQKSLEDARPQVPAGKADRALIAGRIRPRRRDPLQGRPADSGRPGGDGRRHPPQHALAESAGIYCNRGIVVNDTMQTYDPKVYAVGECVAHRGIAYGLVAPLFEQAKVCANHLANYGIGRYTGSVTSTKLKVTGIDLFSAGNFMGGEGTEEIVLNDPPAACTRSW
jgi:nitrite reductase (NADH) large subunit